MHWIAMVFTMSTDKHLNLLVAYPYCCKPVINELKKISDKVETFRFLLDSGAFTAHNSGKDVSLDEYCRFIENLPLKPWRYFSLDVIGDAEATMRNYEIMIKRGFNPVPVFTNGDKLNVLDEYYKTSDMVGVGGLVGLKKNELLNSVYNTQKHVEGKKTHLLGFTRIEHLKKLRPYSCDSSSWETGSMFGNTRFYLGKGNFLKLERKDFIGKPSERLLRLALEHGVDIRDLASESRGWRGGNSASRVASARAWLKCSIDVEKNIGTKLFLATSASQTIANFGDMILDEKN